MLTLKTRRSISAAAAALALLLVTASIIFWSRLDHLTGAALPGALAPPREGGQSVMQPSVKARPTPAGPLTPPANISGRDTRLSDLLAASSSGDSEKVAAMISRVLQSAEGVQFMMTCVSDERLPLEARKHAAEALMRASTEASVQAVVTAATREFEAGRTEAGGVILSSLRIPVGVEGAKALLKVLAGRHDSSAARASDLPAEVRSTLRKSLRHASDAEAVGRLLAQIYTEMQGSGDKAGAEELLAGAAHPAMLGELAAQAQAQGSSPQVTSLLDQLIATEDPGVVGALTRLVSAQPSLLTEGSEAMFNWSLAHPGLAEPGLFTEYLSNQALPQEQRVVASYGLAGLTSQADARRVLEKSISAEPDATMRGHLQNALLNLQNTELPGPLKNSPAKK